MRFHSLIFIFLLLRVVKGPLPYRISTSCKEGTANYEKYLGILTPYRLRANYNDTPIIKSNCKLLKIFMVIRHGTKLPGQGLKKRLNKDLTDLSDRADKYDYKATICAKELEMIKAWNIETLSYESKKLSAEGEEEMTELGERTRDRFPDFFPHNYYHPDQYEFRYGRMARANGSYYHFVIGLFGMRITHQIRFEKPEFGDPLLLFDKACNKWLGLIKHNKTAKSKITYFEEGDEMKDVFKQVATRLAHRSEDGRILRTLTLGMLLHVYKACGLGIAINQKKLYRTMDGEGEMLSPWCFVLSKSSIKTIEYYKDLKHYIIDGYEHALTRQIACHLVNYIIERLEAKRDELDERKFWAYFVQAGAFIKILTYLNLYKDEMPLGPYNMHHHVNRKFRSSYLAPYGANLAFVLYDCGGEKKIMLMHLEREVDVPGCMRRGLCPFNRFKQLFYTGSTCNHSEMCAGKKGKMHRVKSKERRVHKDEL